MALDHIAIHGMVAVVCKGSSHRQVDHWRVTDAVPAVFDRNGTLVLVFHDGSGEINGQRLLHIDAVHVLRHDMELVVLV